MPNDAVIPSDIVSLADYERHARARLDPAIWAYLSGAGADGITRAANRSRLDAIRLSSRLFADLGSASTATELLGLSLEAPILVAPMAFHALCHRDGEVATALGAGAMRAVLTVSMQASVELETVARHAHAPLWFQLYMHHGRDASLALVRRAEAAGYKALVVTADAPVSGVRDAERRAGFTLPAGVGAVNLAGVPAAVSRAGPGQSPVFRGLLDRAPTWEDFAWLRRETRLPVLLKGVVSPADAAKAIDLGADGLVVSNHGGRTLDTLPAAIDILPRVADTVRGRVPVLMDGGIRRGTDVLKAIALGADAVMVGQPILHGLAVGGAAGVAHVLSMLAAELEAAMALSGCATISSIDASALWPGA
jgi:4-hydroxymandelate oxidase